MSGGEEIGVFLDTQDPEVKPTGLEIPKAGMERTEKKEKRRSMRGGREPRSTPYIYWASPAGSKSSMSLS